MLWIMFDFNRNKKNPFEQNLAHFKVFKGIMANIKRKNNLNMLWIMYEFNRNKKNPFEQKLDHLKVFWAQKLTLWPRDII